MELILFLFFWERLYHGKGKCQEGDEGEGDEGDEIRQDAQSLAFFRKCPHEKPSSSMAMAAAMASFTASFTASLYEKLILFITSSFIP